MELRRLAKALSDRWILIVVLAALGVAAALVFGTVSNQNQTSRFEATASIRFVPPEGGEIATLADEIAAAQSIASLAAADLLENQPNSRIVEDLANQRLNFIAQGSSREDATESAGALLQAYLSVDPEAGIPVEQLMAEIEAEVAETQARIDSMQASPTEEAEQLAASIAFIDEQIAAIQQRLVSLVVEEAAADAAGRNAIAAQRNYLTTQLNALQEEKAALGTVPEPELSTQDTLMLAALQARLDNLTAEYQRLYLRQSGVASEGSGIEPTVVVDLTPAPIRPIVSASIGLLGGLLIAVLATLFLNRTRRPVWLAEDVQIPLLGEVPPRPVSADTSENWYDSAEPGQRKTSIQAIRATIEAQVATSGATIGLTSHSVAAEDVQAFAADLASSLASAGTSVLLVDANFESRSPLGQYKVGGASVSGVLELNPSTPEFGAQVRYIAESAFRIRAGLSVIPSGPPPSNPADSLAGRAFRQLIADAQEIYDVVVVVVDEVDTPSAQVTLQRLGYGILVLTPGKSTIPDVEGVLRDMERLRITMLGTVFLGKVSRLPGLRSRREAVKQQPPVPSPVEETPAPSPISRLQQYPIPDERSTAVVAPRALDGLAVDVGAKGGESPDDFTGELLDAIHVADPEHAYESVARYLVSQTSDMVLARHGHGGLSQELIGAMSDFGFMSLRPLNGFKTPAEWLIHEISSEVGEAGSAELIQAMEQTLADGEGEVSIDQWLDDEYFTRHLDQTGGEPNVWHLTSPKGNVSILVPARRMSAQQWDLILAEVASRTIDEFERARSDMAEGASLDQEAIWMAKIRDVRQFERSINHLLARDGNGNARKDRDRIWRPDWSRGTRANLAPLQAAGLLPSKVLSPEELSELLASA